MMKKIKLTRYPLTALAVVVIWTLCLIPIPETPLNQISLIDKWTHLVLFGGLTVIIWAEMLRDDKRRTKEAVYSDPKALSPSYKILSRRYALWGGLAPWLMGGLIEIVQATCTHGVRSGDPIDFMADGVGVLLGMAIGILLARFASTSNKG
ncbi:MAG: VanZ family protein [Prevotella sp.]|nr:VanZ family protein [Prevotella sp.]